ncbi:uncharacterized protein PAC_01891 [Phialocephala subalpina]|uniref:Uncharacterized protein n=1 Tax=Phialocephala subalpina TaxID=576137 RepID=A0A1L7WGV8_9HELO|nr:uncharacterized protein PAC_01891 [Phialocephala subalpina]
MGTPYSCQDRHPLAWSDSSPLTEFCAPKSDIQWKSGPLGVIRAIKRFPLPSRPSKIGTELSFIFPMVLDARLLMLPLLCMLHCFSTVPQRLEDRSAVSLVDGSVSADPMNHSEVESVRKLSPSCPMIKFILVDGKGGNGSVYYVAADVDSKIVGDSNGQKQRLFQSRLLLNLAASYTDTYV